MMRKNNTFLISATVDSGVLADGDSCPRNWDFDDGDEAKEAKDVSRLGGACRSLKMTPLPAIGILTTETKLNMLRHLTSEGECVVDSGVR